KDVGLALFCVVALHYAHATEGFSEASCDLGVDLRPLAKDGPNRLECTLQNQCKGGHDDEGSQGHSHADMQEVRKRKGGCQHTTDKVHDARTDNVPHALYVGHDSGHESASAVLIVKGNGQAADVLLHLLAELSDHPLTGFRE